MIGSKDECLDKIAEYAKVGVTHFLFSLRWPILVEEEFQAFAEEVIPAVAPAVGLSNPIFITLWLGFRFEATVAIRRRRMITMRGYR